MRKSDTEPSILNQVVFEMSMVIGACDEAAKRIPFAGIKATNVEIRNNVEGETVRWIVFLLLFTVSCWVSKQGMSNSTAMTQPYIETQTYTQIPIGYL